MLFRSDKITYSTDVSTATTSANLTTGTNTATGASNQGTAGYVAGGNTGAVTLATYKLNFTTDATSASNNLSQARGGPAGVDGPLRYQNVIIGSGGITSGDILSGNIGFNHLGIEVYNNDVKRNNFRISVVSGLPVTSGQLTSQTTIYMVPYNGETISLFDGSDWAPVTASGTSVSISKIGRAHV